MQKPCFLAYLVSLDDIQWFELPPRISSTTFRVGPPAGPPNSESEIVVLLGGELVSWRESDIDLDQAVEGFVFEDDAFLHRSELYWTGISRAGGVVAQAWLPKHVFRRVLQILDRYTIVQVSAAPISLGYQRSTLLKCNGSALYFDPERLSADLVDPTDSRYAYAASEAMVEGAIFRVDAGQFDIPTSYGGWASVSSRYLVTFAAISLITLAIHVALGKWIYGGHTDQGRNIFSALVWLDVVKGETSFHGRVDQIRVTQFGNRLELVFEEELAKSSVELVRRGLPAVSVNQPNLNSLVIEVAK